MDSRHGIGMLLGLAVATAAVAGAAPSAPTGLVATPANARAMVSWSAVTGADSYNVYRATVTGGPYGTALATGLTATSFTDATAANDTTYYYVATAVDAVGESGFSNEDWTTPRDGTFVAGLIGSSSSASTTTWTLANSPYVVTGDIEVRGNANTTSDRTSTLVIEPGVTVYFENDTRLLVGTTSTLAGFAGRLLATGATFTANRTTPAPGDWGGIRFDDSARDGGANNFLESCVVEWAGGGTNAAVVINRSQPELRGGTAVRQTASGGVYVSDGTAATIVDSEIEGGGSSPAVRVLGFSSLTLTGTTLRGGSFPVEIGPNVVISALAGNTLEGYGFEQAGLAVDGGLMGSSGSAQSRTWPGGDLPYIVLGTLEVRGDGNTTSNRTSSLVIGAGSPATVRFASGARLLVGRDGTTLLGYAGRLEATSVTFTANEPAPAPGFWQGLYFADSAIDGGSNIFLDDCVVEWAGGGVPAAVVVNFSHPVLRNGTTVRQSASGGVHVSASASVTITDGTIEGAGGSPAIRVLGSSALSLTGTTLRGGSFPVEIEPNVVLSALAGNMLEGYGFEQAALAIDGGLMGSSGGAQSRTWPGGDLPYLVLGDLAVRGDANTTSDRTSTLVIAGATVRFAAEAGMTIGLDGTSLLGYAGRLQATSVAFTANEPAPTPGFWQGLYFAETSRAGEIFLDACVVEGAGGADSAAAVALNATSLDLRNGTVIRTTANGGLHLSGSGASALTMAGGEVEGGSDPAVRALGRSTLSLIGVTLRGGSYPIHIQPNVVLAGLGGSTLEGYGPEQAGIAVDGGILGTDSGTQSRTWPSDFDYLVLGDIEVRGNANTTSDRTSTLNVNGPTQVRFAPGTGMTIGTDNSGLLGFAGRLRATGVTFTANSTAPEPGFWKGLSYGDSAHDGAANNLLDGCEVAWAGGDSAGGAVRVLRMSLTLRRTRILTPGSRGAYAEPGSALSITDSEIEGGTGEAVRVLGSSTLTLARSTLRGGTYPVHVEPNTEILALNGNHIQGYDFEHAGIAVTSGVMGSGNDPQTRIWPGGDLPYVVLGDLEIRGNANTTSDRLSTLIIGAGAEVRFIADARLFVGLDGTNQGGFQGQLRATGVTFTASSETPAAGFWKGIYFRDSTFAGTTQTYLDGCTVEWAGGGGASGAVAVNGTSVGLTGTRVLAPASSGVFVTATSASTVTIDGGVVEGGSAAAVRVLDRGRLSLTGATLRGGPYPVHVQPNTELLALAGNTAQGYDAEHAGIAVDGGVMGGGSAQTRAWPGGDLPYLVLADLTVRGDVNNFSDITSTLVVGPGAQVRFESGAGLFIGDDTGWEWGHGGRLRATGVTFTANSTVPSPGHWKGIDFGHTTFNGPTETYLDDCTVDWAGGGFAGAVVVDRSIVALAGTRVLHTASAGVYLTADGTSQVTLTGSVVEGGSDAAVRVRDRAVITLADSVLRGGTYPVRIEPNVVPPAVAGNTFEGYDLAHDGVAVDGGLMGGSGVQTRIWSGDARYVVLADLTVRGTVNNFSDVTSTLVLQPGAELRFEAGAGLAVGDDSGWEWGHGGRLQATGVTFTANTETPTPGFWKGLYFADTARNGGTETFLDGATVQWAGGGVDGAVRVNASAIELRGGTAVRNPLSAGIHLTSSSASSVTIRDAAVEGGLDAAVRALGTSQLAITGTLLRGGTYPVRMAPNVVLNALAGNRLESFDFEHAGVAVDGGLMGGGAQTRIWPGDLPYVVLGDLTVRGNVNNFSDVTSTLVLQSGGEVRFAPGTGLTVGDDTGWEWGHGGRLQATGVVFTANSASLEPGFWKGLDFRNTARDDDDFLVDCTVGYAGFRSASDANGAGVTVAGSTPRFDGVAVRRSSFDGFLVANASPAVGHARLVSNVHGLRLTAGGAPQITNSNVEGNALFGVKNETSTTISALDNWWGDASGPRADANPGGQGDAVSAGVAFAPWRESSALPPVAPTGVTATPGNGRVTVSWNVNPEQALAGYDVYRRQPPAGVLVRLTATPTASTSLVDGGRVNQTEYCYHVRAVDAEGREGEVSRTICATPKEDLEPPQWVDLVGVRFAAGGDGTATLRFEPAEDDRSTVRYNVYYANFSPVDRLNPSTFQLLGQTPRASSAGYSLELTVSGLAPGRWFFNLQAVDGDGNEDGNTVEASTVVDPAAGALVTGGPWTGATLDGVEIAGDGRAVLAAGASEGQLTTPVLELPPDADLASLAWSVVEPAGAAVDTIPGGGLTIEVRAAGSAAAIAGARCVAPPAGLTAWWPGDGHAADLAGGREALLRGNTTFADGRLDRRAFAFDGSGDYLDVAIDVSESAYTLSLWFATTCSSCGLFSVDAGTLGSGGHDRHLYLSGGNLCARVWSNETICTAGAHFADGAWHHVAHVFGGAVGGQKIYADGVERAAGNKASSDFNWQDGVNVGFSNDAASSYFNGRMAHVALFDAALDAAAVATLAGAALGGVCPPDGDGDEVPDAADLCPDTPQRTAVNRAGCPADACFEPSSAPVAWWRGEGDGADSTAGHDATLAGGAGFAAGRIGQAFVFDGATGHGEVASFGAFDQVSVGMWVFREGATGTRESIISYKEGGPASCGFLTVLNEDGSGQRPRQFVQVNGGWQSVEGDAAVPLGTWTHLAGTYDGSHIRLYVDGELAQRGAFAGVMTQCTSNVALGSRASFDRHYFPGRVDEPAVFDRPLAAAEIRALAAAEPGLCASPPPPPAGPPGTPQIEEGWVRLERGQYVDLPDGRYVQVRFTLRGDGVATPRLRSLSLGYAP